MTDPRSSAPKPGVVIQAAGADPALVVRAAQHAANLVRDVGAVPVDVVVQGAAVAALVDGSDAVAQAARLLAAFPTVRLLACRNAMRAHEVDESRLAPGVGAVPAGIGHIARRQWEGWAYAASN